MARRILFSLRATAGFRLIEGSGEGGGEFFVEGEEEFNPFAVAVEGFLAVAKLNGAVEFGMGFLQCGRHGQGIVQIGEARFRTQHCVPEYRHEWFLDCFRNYLRGAER